MNERGEKTAADSSGDGYNSKGESISIWGTGACLEYNIRLGGAALRHASSSQRRVRGRFVVY